MLRHFRHLDRPLRRGFSFLLGLGAATSISIGMPQAAVALPWWELLIRGAQIFQLSNLSPQERIQLGQDIHRQVLDNYNLESDYRINTYVDRVGQRVAASSDCSQYPFKFFVIEDQEINAFTTTGGYVYVNTGLLSAADNEAQLAGVLAHEIGHICNDDLVEQLREASIAQGAASIAGLERSVAANLAYRLAFQLPNSRQDEFAADAEGLQYLRRAGYNPQAMPAFLSKLLKYPAPPEFISNHPATQARIDALQRQITANRSVQ